MNNILHFLYFLVGSICLVFIVKYICYVIIAKYNSENLMNTINEDDPFDDMQ